MAERLSDTEGEDGRKEVSLALGWGASGAGIAVEAAERPISMLGT